VYSFGIILWELITGDVPWAGETAASLMMAVVTNKRRPELSEPQAKSILGGLTQRCWGQEHARRPSFEQLQRELQAAAQQSLDLLCFVCSPRISVLKQALDEAREIKGELEIRGELCGGRCEIVSHDATAEKLRQLLSSTPTRRFLFSGHCNAPWDQAADALRETLAFTEPGGGVVTVEPATLASILNSHTQAKGGELELVFLNGCNSEALGRAVHQGGVACVVCWKTRVHDRAARVFACAFFKKIAAGGRCDVAFEEAKRAVECVTRKGTIRTPTGPMDAEVPMFELVDPDAPRMPTASGQPPPRSPPPTRAGVPLLLLL